MATSDKKRAAAKKPAQATGRAGSRTTAKGHSTRQKQPVINRALRDLRVVEMHLDGRSYGDIAAIDGRHVRTLKGIVEAHRESGMLDGAKLLKMDPIAIMTGMLNRNETIYQAAFEMALSATGNANAHLGALKLMLDAQEKKLQLAQHLNILPRNLGTVRHIVDLRAMGEQMVEILLAVERGEKTATEAVDFFRGLADYGKPQLPETIEGTARDAA